MSLFSSYELVLFSAFRMFAKFAKFDRKPIANDQQPTAPTGNS
jgi:hypothetical protein